MGTVPAPNIAQASAQNAEIAPNVAAQYARAQQETQQTALAQQETRQAAMQNAAAKIQLQEQQTMRTLAPQYVTKDQNGKPTGFDTEGYYNALLGQGVNPGTVAAQRQAQINMQKSMIGLNEETLKLHGDMNDRAYELVEPLRQHASDPNASIDDINQTWQGVAASLQKLGIGPQHLPASFQSPQEMKTALDNFEAELGQHKQQLADSKTQADTNAQNAKARQDDAAAKHQEIVNNLATNSKPGDFDNQIDAMITGKDPNSVQQAGFVKSQVNAALKRGDFDAAKKFIDQAYDNQLAIAKETNPQVQAGKVEVAKNTAIARQQAQMGNYGQAGDPMIDMVGQGRVDLSTAMSRVPPAAKERFLTNLAAAYPEYQQQVYQTRQALMKSATSGDIGKNITAYNTAIAHANQLSQAADALTNGDMPTLNKIGNALGYQ